MGSERRNKDQEFEEAVAKLIGGLLVAGLALYVYPQSLGAFAGAVVGGAYPWRFDDRVDRRHWRVAAGWLIAAGLALAAAYLLFHAALGADAELRRFDRQWGPGHLSAAALIDHPWAWLPLATAAALVAAGGAILWRAR
ncbi:MAG: hypothetical protein QOI10_3457 [Solirubrobacterales bacterium]|jgi:hypothetical protein|nr:hypothetical protein [Solirubrobacterales bacterium]